MVDAGHNLFTKAVLRRRADFPGRSLQSERADLRVVETMRATLPEVKGGGV